MTFRPKTLFERMSEAQRVARPITERMAEAKAKMLERRSLGWNRSEPKAFYLNDGDFAEFKATDPPEITARFRNSPSVEIGFDGVAVRAAAGVNSAGVSRLYSEAGTSISVPIT